MPGPQVSDKDTLREFIKYFAMINGISKKEAIEKLIKKLKKAKG